MKDDVNVCKFCFESESKAASMINPCKCKGTSKWVHEKCLKTWLANVNATNSPPKCEVCKVLYDIRPQGNPMKKLFGFIKIHPRYSLGFFTILLILTGGTLALYKMISNESREFKENRSFYIAVIVLLCVFLLCAFSCGIEVVKKILEVKTAQFIINPYNDDATIITTNIQDYK